MERGIPVLDTVWETIQALKKGGSHGLNYLIPGSWASASCGSLYGTRRIRRPSIMRRSLKWADSFLARGFCYFDTAYNYHKEQSEAAIREAVVKRHPRDSFLLADKMPAFLVDKPDDFPRFFEEQLKRCAVSRFDFYLLHNLGSERYEKMKRLGAFEFMQSVKEQGMAGEIGFSFHDTADTLDQILTEHPEIDFVQLQLNYLDWESGSIQSRLCYETARKHGKPITVMEPAKGGALARLEPEAEQILKEYDPDASAASWGHPLRRLPGRRPHGLKRHVRYGPDPGQHLLYEGLSRLK